MRQAFLLVRKVKALLVLVAMLAMLLCGVIALAQTATPAAEPAAIDFTTLFGYFAPLVVILLTQVLKVWIQSKYAPLIVILLGGVSALLSIGPSPGTEFIDTTINATWVSGVAALIYDAINKLTKAG